MEQSIELEMNMARLTGCEVLLLSTKVHCADAAKGDNLDPLAHPHPRGEGVEGIVRPGHLALWYRGSDKNCLP